MSAAQKPGPPSRSFEAIVERRRPVETDVRGSSVLTETSHTSTRPSPVTLAKQVELLGDHAMSAT